MNDDRQHFCSNRLYGATYPGFTLVELLVAIAVLMLVSLLLLNLTGGTQKATGASVQRIDVDSQGQLALTRLFSDFSSVVASDDMPWLISNGANGAPSLTFFTRVRSSSGDRDLSLVSYRIAAGDKSGDPVASARLCLQRASKGVAWTDTRFMGVTAIGETLALADLPPSLTISDSDFDILAEGAVRMAVTCQLLDSSLQVNPPLLANGNYDLAKLRALVVTLVVMDVRSMRMLSPAQISAVAAVFPSPVDAATPAAAWTSIANKPDDFPSGIPQSAVKSLKVYQQIFAMQHSGQL